MGFLENLGRASISALTTDVQFEHLREENKRLTAQLQTFEAEQKHFSAKAESEIQNLRERVLKLETLREADKKELQAEVARFKADVERFEARLSRQLPPPTDTN